MHSRSYSRRGGRRYSTWPSCKDMGQWAVRTCAADGTDATEVTAAQGARQFLLVKGAMQLDISAQCGGALHSTCSEVGSSRLIGVVGSNARVEVQLSVLRYA